MEVQVVLSSDDIIRGLKHYRRIAKQDVLRAPETENPESFLRHAEARRAVYAELTAIAEKASPRDVAQAALEAYRRQARDPARIAAMCADYRAGATTDRATDEADRAAGRRIAVPLMFLCGRHGFPAQTGNPGALWKNWAEDVRTATCESGHFAMEENPEAVLDAFLPFFREAGAA